MNSDKQGVIIKSTGKLYKVKTLDNTIFDCTLRGNFRIKGIKTTNPLAVGDKVVITQQDDRTGIIKKIIPRSNYVIRKSTKLSKQVHIIAANLDQAIIIATLSYPRTSTGFIDRILVTAEAYHIPPKIVFNKNDIYTPEEKKHLEMLITTYRYAGYDILVTSAKKRENLESLKTMLDDKISAVIGHSGVGKSALINAIVPGLNLRLGELSDVHMKGKHTTTFAEMHEIWANTCIVDTPGIKEFGLIDIEKNELRLYFPEMMAAAENCKFYNCTHIHEPGCAVKKKVENEEIAEFRYKNYLTMMSGEEMNLNHWELK
ncbi:MAG: ribosome small subunit-dependent GTPase A [Bacteroidales bacterium]|nr:ribosome small subunit-dependent GTPase A [Bacteroidales bacterium]